MPKPEPFVIGAEHADKIGRVVTLIIEQEDAAPWKPDRELITGVLTLAQDEYRGDEVKRTILLIGGSPVYLDWDNATLTVEIDVLPAGPATPPDKEG